MSGSTPEDPAQAGQPDPTVMATVGAPGPDEAAILTAFGIGPDRLLGAGGESRVFALDEDRVLRIFGGLFDRSDHALVEVVNRLATADIGVLTPLVLEVGSHGDQQWTIDRRVPGESLDHWLSCGHPDGQRRAVLRDYTRVAARLRQLPLPARSGDRALAGHFTSLGAPDRVAPGASLVDLLREQAAVGLRASGGLLAAAVADLPARVDELFARLEQRQVEPAFVHADYFPGNVMVHQGRVSGVLDISVHALAADPVMDQVAAVCFLEHLTDPRARADVAWLEDELRTALGEQAWLVEAYRRWYALYYAMDPALIAWSAAQFTRVW